MRLPLAVTAALVALVLLASPARADDDAAKAGEAFTAGLAAAKEQKWGEALAAFERAAASKSHPLTTYNIGVAERALGQYTRARAHLEAALAQNTASGGNALATGITEQARVYLAEIDKLLVHVDVTVEPGDASLLVDGRPLQPVTGSDHRVQYAGIAAAGPDAPVKLPRFEVLMDPGTHVFTVAKGGYETKAPRAEYRPGVHALLVLSLTAMPAKLAVDAERAGAVVTLDELDLGVNPVVVDRPAGDYKLEVKKKGFVTYQSKVTLHSGERTDIFAKLAVDTPITSRWWFWTGVGVLVVGAAITSYALLYNPSYDGGNRGWVAQPR